MAPKKTPRPEWITALVQDTVAELLEHAAIRIEELEAKHRGELHEGQLTPALVQAIQEELKTGLDRQGAEAVQVYTETRKAAGTPAQEAQGEELGPLLGLTRAGVYHAFSRRA